MCRYETDTRLAQGMKGFFPDNSLRDGKVALGKGATVSNPPNSGLQIIRSKRINYKPAIDANHCQ